MAIESTQSFKRWATTSSGPWAAACSAVRWAFVLTTAVRRLLSKHFMTPAMVLVCLVDSRLDNAKFETTAPQSVTMEFGSVIKWHVVKAA